MKVFAAAVSVEPLKNRYHSAAAAAANIGCVEVADFVELVVVVTRKVAHLDIAEIVLVVPAASAIIAIDAAAAAASARELVVVPQVVEIASLEITTMVQEISG